MPSALCTGEEAGSLDFQLILSSIYLMAVYSFLTYHERMSYKHTCLNLVVQLILFTIIIQFNHFYY